MEDTKRLVVGCPFCSGVFITCPGGEDFAVGHDKPVCQEFDQWEPDEFLHNARKMIEWKIGRNP